jgi:hypothetical protein
MKVRRLSQVLSLFAVAGLAAACASTTSSSQTAAIASESCAAKADPTALKLGPGSGITAPKVLHRVEPLAPEALRGREALATVEAVIGEDGKARHICFREGDREWGQAIAAVLGAWRFEPATLDGKPVAVVFTLTSRLRQ